MLSVCVCNNPSFIPWGNIRMFKLRWGTDRQQYVISSLDDATEQTGRKTILPWHIFQGKLLFVFYLNNCQNVQDRICTHASSSRLIGTKLPSFVAITVCSWPVLRPNKRTINLRNTLKSLVINSHNRIKLRICWITISYRFFFPPKNAVNVLRIWPRTFLDGRHRSRRRRCFLLVIDRTSCYLYELERWWTGKQKKKKIQLVRLSNRALPSLGYNCCCCCWEKSTHLEWCNVHLILFNFWFISDRIISAMKMVKKSTVSSCGTVMAKDSSGTTRLALLRRFSSVKSSCDPFDFVSTY